MELPAYQQSESVATSSSWDNSRTLRLALGPAWHDSGLVLTSEVGIGLDPMNVYHRYVTLVKRAGVSRISFHAASRHTCATVAMTSGVHPRVVQELLGHADIAMTLGTYSHILPEMHQEAASIIAQAMRRKSGTTG